MSLSTYTNRPSSPYVVLIMNWTDTGAHWVKGFATFEEARDAAVEKAMNHKEINDRIVIIKGEILQIGSVGP